MKNKIILGRTLKENIEIGGVNALIKRYEKMRDNLIDIIGEIPKEKIQDIKSKENTLTDIISLINSLIDEIKEYSKENNLSCDC